MAENTLLPTEVTYTENGITRGIGNAETPEDLDQGVAFIRQMTQDAGLPEIFNAPMVNPFNSEENIQNKIFDRTMLGMELLLSPSVVDQQRLIEERMPSSNYDLDDEGRLIVTFPVGQEGSNEFIRGFVNAPGFSAMDVKSTSAELALFTPAGRTANFVTAGGRFVRPVLRGATTAIASGLTEVGRQQLIDVMTGSDLSEDDTSRMLDVGLVMSMGVAAELVAPLVSGMHRWVRNKKFVDKKGELTFKGQNLFRSLGIEPEMITKDLIAEFKRTPASRFKDLAPGSIPDKAAIEALMARRPDLITRMALQGKATGTPHIGANGKSVIPALDAARRVQQQAWANVTKNFSSLKAFNPEFKNELNTAFSNLARADLNKAGFLPGINKETDEAFKALNTIFQKNGVKDSVGAFRAYNTWRMGLINKSNFGRANSRAQEGRKVLLDSTDNSMRQFTLEHLTYGSKANKNKLFKALTSEQDFLETFTGSEILDTLLTNQYSAEETASILFNLNRTNGKTGAIAALEGLERIVGRNSDEFIALKGEMVGQIADVAIDESGNFSRSTFNKEMNQFLRNNKEMADVLFDPPDLKILRNLGEEHVSRSVEGVIGDFLTVRYGVSGSAVAGGLRRLGNIGDSLLQVRKRPIFSSMITAMGLSQAQNTSEMIKGIDGVIEFARSSIGEMFESDIPVLDDQGNPKFVFPNEPRF